MMSERIKFQSSTLQQIVAEADVAFLLARMRRHAPHMFHHSLRVAGLFEMYWDGIEITENARIVALRSVLLHDIGCIHIPREQLNEPHERHTLIGIEILSSMIKEGRIDKDLILYHHENLDGTGFPFGMNWKGLSPMVRSLRIVDDFDVWSGGMYTELSISVAMDELYMWSDIQFDRYILERFNKIIQEAIQQKPTQIDAISRM
jgi:HD-GYP domain-containing protein (c-di-GMP phosphodiesterase class II)